MLRPVWEDYSRRVSQRVVLEDQTIVELLAVYRSYSYALAFGVVSDVYVVVVSRPVVREDWLSGGFCSGHD